MLLDSSTISYQKRQIYSIFSVISLVHSCPRVHRINSFVHLIQLCLQKALCYQLMINNKMLVSHKFSMLLHITVYLHINGSRISWERYVHMGYYVSIFQLFQKSDVKSSFQAQRISHAKNIMKPFVLRRLKKDVSGFLCRYKKFLLFIRLTSNDFFKCSMNSLSLSMHMMRYSISWLTKPLLNAQDRLETMSLVMIGCLI